ncbi:MAG: hypothetical protein ACOH2L_19650 [Devosia sp.]
MALTSMNVPFDGCTRDELSILSSFPGPPHTEQLFSNPQHDYTRMLLSAVPRPKWQQGGILAAGH